MNQKILFSALCLLSGLAVCALPGPALALSKDDAALVDKINGLYYNCARLGLHKFKCELKNGVYHKVLTDLKAKVKEDDPLYLGFKDVRFFMTYDEQNGMQYFYTNYKPTGDPEKDAELKNFLDDETKTVLQVCWQEWFAWMFGPLIATNDPNVGPITVKKTNAGYEVDQTLKSVNAVEAFFFNPDLVLTEMDVRHKAGQGDNMTYQLGYLKNPDGNLANAVTVTTPKIEQDFFLITYKNTSNYQLPSQCILIYDLSATKAEKETVALYNFDFFNYQLN
jgi:hypothetical protein